MADAYIETFLIDESDVPMVDGFTSYLMYPTDPDAMLLSTGYVDPPEAVRTGHDSNLEISVQPVFNYELGFTRAFLVYVFYPPGGYYVASRIHLEWKKVFAPVTPE